MVDSRQPQHHYQHQRPLPDRDQRREEVAASLRQAFPIDGSGSFAGLLRALESAPR